MPYRNFRISNETQDDPWGQKVEITSLVRFLNAADFAFLLERVQARQSEEKAILCEGCGKDLTHNPEDIRMVVDLVACQSCKEIDQRETLIPAFPSTSTTE